MESSSTGISRLDCYEDMFKEITRKLYGDDPDHRTSSVQNEFEASVSYKNDEDTGNTDISDDGNWTCEEEPLKGTDGSRIAAYHAGKATWRCYECGDVTSGGPREAAEHFLELHSSRILSDDSRNRHHSPRKDYLQTDFKIEDIVSYLERLRERAERAAPPTRRTQETQTVPAALLPMTSSFLLQEIPSTSPQHLHQNTTGMPNNNNSEQPPSEKRYNCPICKYGTDRRDLFTRHENIHRQDKPFECYICFKPFNRADHVKKHFSRMHREHEYDITRTRRPVGTSAQRSLHEPSTSSTVPVNASSPQVQQHTGYQPAYTGNKDYQLSQNVASGMSTSGGIYQATTMPTAGLVQPDATNCTTNRRVQNGGCNSKSHLKGSSKSTQDRRFTCYYCTWSGVDSWCLRRHLNTHLKPFACSLCEYKAARSERLATHVLKVHNRRLCSKCSFLAEDAEQLQIHQLHVHRVSSSNTSATSTTQVTPPTNRHQQPLHPAGGGRAPPGPPVFPAPAPTIVPATTVMSTTTILGHEMVKSPATAATMAYSTEEEKRSYRHIAGTINGNNNGDDNGKDDNDNVVRVNGNCETRETRDLNVCHVCGFKNNKNNNLELCSEHNNENSKNGAIDMSNDDFICSYQIMLLYQLIKRIVEKRMIYLLLAHMQQQARSNHEVRPPKRQPRKQKSPRKVLSTEEEDTGCDSLDKDESPSKRQRLQYDQKYRYDQVSYYQVKNIYQRPKTQKYLRCYRCPRHAPARGTSQRPYHTKASLTLHKLWRHKKKLFNIFVTKIAPSTPISSITVKATFIASPNYPISYHS